MVRDVPTVREDASCGDALRSVRERPYPYAEAVVVIDAGGRVLGAASISRAAGREPGDPIAAVLERACPLVGPNVHQERVASLAIHSPLAIVLVVDDRRRLLGVVPPAASLRILRREHVEDLHRLSGVARENESAREAIEAPPARRARHRLPWLLVGLAGSIVAALVMAQFEMVLAERVAVAFFIPGIVYLADAIGTQTEAIAVRGLSLSHQPMSRLLYNEVATGVLLGAVLGAVALCAVWIALGDARLAIAVGVSLFAAGAIATVVGLTLPWGFDRMGLDPAYGSGPLGTVIQDVLSLLAYFAAITLLL